jgi:magnesium chelatase family protein
LLASVNYSALAGVDALQVEVEVDVASGVPKFRMVGLAEGAVREAYDRVKSAIRNSGYDFPNRKITVNLAPADTRKEGSAFDLPMALGILAGAGTLRKHDRLREYVVLGSLRSTAASGESKAHSQRHCSHERGIMRASSCRGRTHPKRRLSVKALRF